MALDMKELASFLANNPEAFTQEADIASGEQPGPPLPISLLFMAKAEEAKNKKMAGKKKEKTINVLGKQINPFNPRELEDAMGEDAEPVKAIIDKYKHLPEEEVFKVIKKVLEVKPGERE